MANNNDGDITDLTRDEGSVGKKKDNKKKVRESGIAKPMKTKLGKPGKKEKVKGEKKSGMLKLKLILISVPIVLILGFVAVLVTNLFSVRYVIGGFVKEPILSAVVWFDPEFSSVNEELRAKSTKREDALNMYETGLGERESKIAEKEAAIEEREGLLNTREVQLDRRVASLDTREEKLNQANKASSTAVPIYLRKMSEQEIADMQSLSLSYSKMAPETAADILAKLNDNKHVAAILYHMGERNAAAILEAMETEFAAKITEILLFN